MQFDLDSELQPVPSKITELDQAAVYYKYCPDFKIGDIHSPFRKENNPSFGFFIRNDIIWWKDSKDGSRGHVIDFIIKWYSMFHQQTLTFKEAFNIALSESSVEHQELQLQDVRTHIAQVSRKVKKKIIVVTTVEGTIPVAFLPYWERLGIFRNISYAYYTNFAVEAWIEKKFEDGEMKVVKWGESTIQDPIYYYYFPQSDHKKLYRPLCKNKKRKWLSDTNNLTDIQGYHQCDIKRRRPKLMVLVKSMKEVQFLRSFGIDAMAIHGENHHYTPEFIAHLRKYCDFIIGVYDNDVPGMRGALRLRQDYDIPIFFTPRNKGKDPTDLYNSNYHLLFELMLELNQFLHDNYNGYTGIGPSTT